MTKKRWWYDALVQNNRGVHRVFYSTSRPAIGSTCPGIASPNKVVGFKRYAAP